MPIYTNDPCDDGLFPMEPSLRSSIGIGPKVTKAIDAATKDWLDNHPEATTTVEDNSLTNAKLMDGSVNSRVIEDESIATNDIADLAVTTSKIANNAVTADKVVSSAVDGLRTMSTMQPGVAKVGAGLAMNNGALELNGGNIAPAVTAWLNAHPEATTTVQDGAVTTVKLADGAVTDAKLAQKNGVLSKVDMLGIFGTNKFTVNAGSSHSSLLDYIGGLGISVGDTFTVTIRQSNPMAIAVYAFASDPPVPGGGTAIHWDNQMAEETFDITAESDIESIGIYQDAAASADNTIEVVIYDRKPPYLYLDIDLPTPHAQHHPAGTYDLNSFYEYGHYSFNASSTFTNAPFDFTELTAGVYTLDVYEIGTNKAGYQILRNLASNGVWMRYFNGNHASFTAWNGYYLTHGAHSKILSDTDFNDLTVADNYMIVTSANHLHSPNVMAMCWLEVTTRQDGVVNQLACYPKIGGLYVRQRNLSNVWSEWHDLAPNSGGLLTIDFTVPMPNALVFKKSITRKSSHIQDIAVYDGHVFDFGSGVMSVDGGDSVTITNGHGNNCNFGTELHGDFPYLYCGAWNMNECAIYVNQVTEDSATLIDTITFSSMTGHLNCVVNEADGKIYILLNKSQSTAVGDIDFIVADLSDGSIISQSELPFAIPVIQGMDYVDGAIYVTYGGAGGYTENHIMVLDTSGRMLANTANITQFTEIEGIAFDGGKMYIADGATIYY